MSEYVSEVDDGPERIAARGPEGTCPFVADLVGGVVLLDAGTEREFVSEWFFGPRDTVDDFLALIRRIVAGEDVGPADRIGDGQLIGYRPHPRRPVPDPEPGGG